MKKFLVIYHVPAADAIKQMKKVTPEQGAKGMQEWMNWAKKCGKHLVDMGTPLMNGMELPAKGKAEKSKKNVSGYSVLEAKNMAEAQKLLKGHPHLNGWSKKASIEVHEAMAIPGM
ncbi:MAG TPA: hypothetical protein VN922_19030 [Bacteroidia bacterium]|nr:hypothetical protein [Bacteroidia bacterium]